MKELTLRELVKMNPAAANVLRRYGLDIGCRSNMSLSQACIAVGIDPKAVIHEIENLSSKDGYFDNRWVSRPIKELIQHILDRYHAPLRTKVPGLVELSHLLERVHADKPIRPEGLADLLQEVCEAVESHLDKEEKILFPLILSGRGQLAYMPVQVMVQEHEDHVQNLRRIRELTKDFAIPAYACASWRELYCALIELEVELMDHINLENNVLFPRVLAG